MTVDLEARLTSAFAERAATTPLDAHPLFRGDDRQHDVGRPRRHLVVAAVVGVSLVGGLVALSQRASDPDRTVSSPGFDGDPMVVDPVRYVPLGLDGVADWTRVSFSDQIEHRASFCTTVAPDGTCATFVGATVSTYENADGARVDITNEFGPAGAASTYWQMLSMGTPVTIRGSTGGLVTDSGSGAAMTAWTESAELRIGLSSAEADLDGAALVALADTLVPSPSPSPITTKLMQVRSFNTDDKDPTSAGPGYLALLAGRIDGHTCVALVGFNGNEECDSGFNYGDGAKAAIAGRVAGSQDQSMVVAILPPGTVNVTVDRFQMSPVDVQPLEIPGFDERFVLELMGTAFPTRVHAFSKDGQELTAIDVDPLFEAGFARGIMAGRAWDLSAYGESGCIYLADVSWGGDDCAQPSVNGLTVGRSEGVLQFGRAGNNVTAVVVDGITYPVVDIPDEDSNAWLAPQGGFPTALGEDGKPLDDNASTDVVPSDEFCNTAAQVVNGGIGLGEVQNAGLLRDDAELSEHQRLLIAVGLNDALTQGMSGPWDNSILVDAVNEVCQLVLQPDTIAP